MSDVYSAETFVKNLQEAIRESVEQIAKDELAKATAAMERRVKQEVGAITIRVAQWANVSLLQDRLVIEVKMDELKKRPS